MVDIKAKTVRLDSRDNVLTALTELSPGAEVETGVICLDAIPSGHKVAARGIAPQEPILKYSQIIGFASRLIKAGEHVHTHNVELRDVNRDYAFGVDAKPTDYLPEERRAHFQGIVRSDGWIATRNHIGVLSTVSCSASVARFIANAFSQETMKDYPNVDGVVALGQSAGCGMGTEWEGFTILQKTMAGYARHPNFAGIVLVGLGCEVNNIDCFMENMKLDAGPHLRTVNIQDAGGTEETVRLGVEAVRSLLGQANRIERQRVSASHLLVGLQCGGSDAFSGISANPALGAAADLIVRHGGTAILSETPEIYGAEHLLTRRAATEKVGQKLIERIRWWEAYTARHGAEINNNPTPGNKAGGLTTILEKSLGAAAKGGTTNLAEVYGYAEAVSAKGLVFMDTPGYDVVSMTGMIAGGANITCFTSGRGTVCGFKPIPTIKLASNTLMYRRMEKDMDFNCGTILEGETTISELGEAIFQLILETASGKKTKNENYGFGESEFVPWYIGAVM
jgi:altronate hydrolase